MGEKQIDICVASCAKTTTEERFKVRDRWGAEMNEIEMKNDKIWA